MILLSFITSFHVLRITQCCMSLLSSSYSEGGHLTWPTSHDNINPEYRLFNHNLFTSNDVETIGRLADALACEVVDGIVGSILGYRNALDA